MAGAALLAPGAAAAHTTAPSRQAVLQVDAQGATLLWRVEVPERQAALLWVSGDANGDGRYDPHEELQLAGSVVARAMRDVSITRGETRWPYQDVHPRLEGPRRQGNLVALALSPLAPVEGFAVRLTVRVGRGGPLGFAVQGLDGWRLREVSQGKIHTSGVALERQVVLREGQSVTIFMERTPAPPSDTGGTADTGDASGAR